ncbi:MAG: nucleotidyltransferase family protein [Nitrospiraceae bacterium]|nr:nucleotidyltransferase family protein [Nitrospiraceae bacterium]
MAQGIDDAIDATDVGEERSGPSTAIIILAAGSSTRMGKPKQLLTYGNLTFLRHAAEVAVASVCRPILIVLGAYASQLQSEIDDLPVRSVTNERWADGMGCSIQVGVGALKNYDRTDNTEALVLMLCDQPYVRAAVINDLVTAYHANDKGIIASEYSGTLGVPALFGREYFAELAAMSGAVGAKRLIAAHASDVMPVPFSKGITDIDTPEDYRQLQRAIVPQAL